MNADSQLFTAFQWPQKSDFQFKRTILPIGYKKTDLLNLRALQPWSVLDFMTAERGGKLFPGNVDFLPYIFAGTEVGLVMPSKRSDVLILS